MSSFDLKYVLDFLSDLALNNERLRGMPGITLRPRY